MRECLNCRSQAVGVQGRHLYIAAGLTFVLSCYFLVRHFYALQEVLTATATATSDPILPAATSETVSDEPELEVSETPPLPKGLPPLYSAYHDVELRLPQQDWTQTEPAPALGWGNAVQEHILNAYLAYKAGRSFVFGNFTWNDDGSPYSDYEGSGKIIPSQYPTPCSCEVLPIYSPIVGEPFAPGDNAPLAVSRDYFDHLCPNKVEFARQELHANLTSPNSVAEITEKWASLLKNLDESCVQSTLDSGPIYSHHDVWGVRMSLLDVWQDLKQSPFLTQFGWSPLVELAFDTNRDLFASSTEPYLSSTPFTSNAERYSPIPGLMAIHVRRGDYATHCRTLAMWSEDFVSVNAFPGMRDPFVVPPHEEWGNNTPENVEVYRRRCLPTIEEIVRKVAEVRAEPEARGVRRLYIMTNGSPEYIAELKDALHEAGSWEMIASSRDLVLSWEQKYVSHAVDLLVAQRAQVLLGNGFSTLTSNAVMMRMANGFPTGSTRFW
ncbi:hypothetical protein C8Q73DRAFT_790163 [Cubamyces lactineus]|nr:hypothetical protein C8Q73DRAFT_790163 [Cubamyces lactineus]